MMKQKLLGLSAAILIMQCATSSLFAEEVAVPDVITMKSKIRSMEKASVGPVQYPHKLHAVWYECDECHPKVFSEKIGQNDVDMNKIISEQYCGSAGCHNSAYAFPLYLCENCHQVP